MAGQYQSRPLSNGVWNDERMRRFAPAIAVIVVLVSLVWGFTTLTASVTPPSVSHPELSCGSVFGSLEGRPNHGGELPYPRDWIGQCQDAARDQVGWIVVPAIAGPVALLYLAGSFAMVARRAKAAGRSTGAPV